MFNIDLKGNIAWICGGSRGIGAASAIALAEAGCDIAISYRSNHEEAEKVACQINSLDKKVLLLAGDLSQSQICQTHFEQIKNELGNINILVNSTGVVADNLFLSLEDSDWQTLLQTNLMSYVYTSKLVIPQMMQSRFGRIINLSSAAAQKSGRGQANYAASKAAIEAMSRSLAVELGKKGITVNCIAPGVIETDMSKQVIALAKDQILERQIIKRFGTTEEIASWVVYLAAKNSGFITGQTIAIDGGLKLP